MASELRDARLRRGWSQKRLVVELQAAAARRGTELPETLVLKTQISRWENGHRVPDEFYRRLLQDAFDLTAPELGFVSGGGSIGPDAALPAGMVSADLLDNLQTSLMHLASVDATAGPQTVLALAREQATFVTGLVRGAIGSKRSHALLVASRLNEFTGWLHQDAGNLDQAARWTDQAISLATEAADPELTAYAVMRRSNIDTDGRDNHAALARANNALETTALEDPRLSGVLLRQRAVAHAMVGDEAACRRDLDDALQMVTTNGVSHNAPSLVPYVTPSYIEMEAANCYLRLGRYSDALGILTQSVRAWPTGSQERDRGLALARLATAYAGAHEVEMAVITGHAALKVLAETKSARMLTQVHDLRRELAPVWDNPTVRDFNHAFTASMAWEA
ncbi:helix-turn-helix transcriptional regulator [Nocardioides sp. KC13]|uniref:Helix-turn-helix transcriptional regulator n=1 Tax=Nocardioides turkmenicus TaxID=2711220 RepID=A0A6M1QVL7_9ACTN|nr:helix-turn-helix transcriptional regulator [Nocardioides sp. KC13]NGN91720.1 helix-turn-helix transcriptional regulator [Nocardioides sp. KC13]